MFITSKRGAQDNIVTYEHICDTTEDLQKIDPHYITLGSTCIVIQGENGGVDMYIATSDKQWILLGNGSGSGSGGSGSGSSEEDTKKYENSDVRFIDYDGKVVDGYSAEEFLQLNKMPKNPDHKNDKIPLTAQGWNWSFEDAQAYVRKYGMLDIGQTYIPSDGKTHLVIDVGVRRTIPLVIQQTVSNGVTINWGDGSDEEVVEGTGIVTTNHTYATEGEYEITLNAADGCEINFGGRTSNNIFGDTNYIFTYTQHLKKLYIGNGTTIIEEGAFDGCYNLTTLCIPDNVTIIKMQAFRYCYTLSNIIIPNGITTIQSNAFRDCYAATSIAIPNSIIYAAEMAFGSCHAVTKLTIPESLTYISTTLFSWCYTLTNLIIPDSVESINNSAFTNCYVLPNLVIPDGITFIPDNFCNSCYALTNFTIPNSVTSIGRYAFEDCYSLHNLTILAETPPTLNNTSIFRGMPADCIIYVPYGTGDTYRAASGWSKWTSRIQELPE